ncbi:MAG: hypothetical protein WDN01_07310 [Rhizomicrobium sp.]
MRLAVAAFAGCLTATAALAGAPDYAVAKADVDLYLDILRAAAAHNAHLAGDDKAAVGGFGAAQLARAKRETDAANADKPLIAPHVAEIVSLKKQIGGFMFGGR